jgi:beta-lactamase class A
VAHKTGWITGVNHDAGIVILPDGRKYVLVLLSKELQDDKAAVKSMAKVSKMIYDYFVIQ